MMSRENKSVIFPLVGHHMASCKIDVPSFLICQQILGVKLYLAIYHT